MQHCNKKQKGFKENCQQFQYVASVLFSDSQPRLSGTESELKQDSQQFCRYRLVSVCFLGLFFLLFFLKTCRSRFVSRGV